MGRRRPALFGPLRAEEELLQELTHPGVDPIGKVRVEPLLVLPQRSVKFLAVQSSIADCDQPAARPVPRA